VNGAPRGLPGTLPAGEGLLWQGSPDWRVLARRAFHIRKLALYFAIIIAWVAVDGAMRGDAPASVGLSLLRGIAIAAVPLVLLAAYAWAVARGSIYTVTSRRVVIRVGLALPVTINLPFARIDAAAVNVRADGTGDIALALRGGDRLAYAVLWPHARPWRLARAEPALRGLRDARPVAQVLARALAASAEMPAPVLHDNAPAGVSLPTAAMPA
jgi:hypothetical protein